MFRDELENKLGCGCPYCGVPMGRKRFSPTRDHMIPRSRGGTLEPGNKVIVCMPCNLSKGDLTIHEFYQALVSYRDPRAKHVARFIEGMSIYFQGRLRIPQVTPAVRATYPRMRYRRRLPKPSFAKKPAVPDDIDEQMSPAMAM